ncbi:M14 family metallocarboxypeptidase [Paenibacillus sp. NEAU-GSW1]|uniref:M14 family metallopeptidase n=1 Tax=Paenibacillus sp. NEAU-GSW1 TaxID=2682486 RepID=UPI0020A68DB2|nr:M14 family metallocarboxypeptidase [Paenibacillus sp. NEAU-GSW1]
MLKLQYRTKMALSLLLAVAMICSLLGRAMPAHAAASPIVDPKQIYTYETMVKDLKELSSAYPDLIKLSTIGESEYGRKLWRMDFGKGPAVILLNASHHAREWMTTTLLMYMVEDYAAAYASNDTYQKKAVRDLLDRVTFVVIPMVNPDGVTLQQKGLSAFPSNLHESLIRMNKGSRNFKRWKANAKGVDLNRQYPAGWSTISNAAPSNSYMNYKGSQPLQAKEAAAMAKLARELKPELAMSYHSSGEIIYWNYKTKAENLARDRALATKYANMTGYSLVAPSPNPSGGGFTDWFISEFGRPAMTPEIGRAVGDTHVPLSEWSRIWGQHRYTGWMLAIEGYKLWMDKQEAKEADGSIYLLATEKGYQWPSLDSKILNANKAGVYELLRVKGDWLEIKAASGRQWISERNALQQVEEAPSDMKVMLSKATDVYTSPLAGKPTAIKYADQKLTVQLAWKEWYMIKTSRGPLWVKKKQVTIVKKENPTPSPSPSASPSPSPSPSPLPSPSPSASPLPSDAPADDNETEQQPE